MNKRIVCVLLTLIMLIGLVPVSAFAAGLGISESAITVLKQLEGYSTTCNANGYTGYGTKCTEEGPHGSHRTNEALSDAALREELKTLDAAINAFASRKGIALSQNKHDALVLFSFENGTAWTVGTGDLQTVVASGKTGSDFLSAICRWDADTSDDIRRMIEANMYLNGVYSTSRPSSFIRVYLDANEMAYELDDGTEEAYVGSINENTVYQYYDVSTRPAPHITPTLDYHTFTGWYKNTEFGWQKVYNLDASHHEEVLVAGWIPTYSQPGTTSVSYVLSTSLLLSERVYYYGTNTMKFGAVVNDLAANYCMIENTLRIDSDYLDEDGIRWCRIAGTNLWVKVADGSTNTNGGAGTDVTVTVTNSYVRSRTDASIYSTQNGTYYQGQTLRIIATKRNDGFLWGQVAKSATDITPVGWVALMYTNYESVRNNTTSTSSSAKGIATAVITYNGYVNVRSDAGTHNTIVSALPKGTEVALFETKFVNGLEWGRCSAGWFCLAYASVERLTQDTSYVTDTGFTAYAFTGTVDPYSIELYEAPSTSANRIYTRQLIDADVTVTNFVKAEGVTWGKIKEGWIQVSDENGNALSVDLDTAKFVVSADSLAVRSEPNTSASRVDALVKGVEFNINYTNQIIVVGDTIWGYATKVGEVGTASYMGWVNLASKNVSRNGAPEVSTDNSGNTGNSGTIATNMMGTVINTNALKVRDTDSTYGNILGTLSYGTVLQIWETNANKTWYRVDSNGNGSFDLNEDGWVSASYVRVSEGTADNNTGSGSTSNQVETGMGVVANTYAGLNVRAGAGTGYAFVCKLLPGTAVEILEVTTVGATKWGRIAQGWVSMDYIAMVSHYPITGTTGNAGSNGTTTSSEVAIYTGAAKVNDVIVYKETSVKSEAVRVLSQNEPVTVHELLTVVVEEVTTPGPSTDTNAGSSTSTTVTKTTTYWARVNDGYIYAPGDNLNLDTLDEHTYTVTGADEVNVRNAAGTVGTTILFKLVKGEKVTVTDLVIVNSNVWGKIETTDEDGQLVTGWVSLAYLTKGFVNVNTDTGNNNTGNNNTGSNNNGGNAGMGNGSNTGGIVDNTSGYRYTGTVIRAEEVNVRATPSTAAAKTTTLKKGAALVIYETTIVDNMAWGRCDAGWIYLYYVDLVPVTGAVDARVVYVDNTVIYTDMNCSGVAGTYAKMAVIDIYEIVGKMARTDKGWVNTDNLL